MNEPPVQGLKGLSDGRPHARDAKPETLHDPTHPVLATRVMKARKVSECPACRQTISVGQLIAKCGMWMHATCAIEHQHDQPRQPMIGWHSGQ